jgi:hypothetical protein
MYQYIYNWKEFHSQAHQHWFNIYWPQIMAYHLSTSNIRIHANIHKIGNGVLHIVGQKFLASFVGVNSLPGQCSQTLINGLRYNWKILLWLELEFFFRQTVSRPVRLDIGPPFGTLDQILSFSSFFIWQLLYSSFWRGNGSQVRCPYMGRYDWQLEIPNFHWKSPISN